ncbi:thiol-disulfide oxidoreductase DCC family protein [Paenibacillus cremeus]|uniref:Thiol-disulfide oxidoreductase DCC family protein n=2 Tax=Paenibacillus cremeus TaxID=2163881 RepID=A0A559JPW9_9BACL|nr:thiol-disulfide oxidoreductase DCC family protein [Paenibacillus cremeus]
MGEINTAAPNAHPVVLYDGTCGLCNRVVQFILRRDRKGKFRFAAIQSETGQRMFLANGLDPTSLDSVVVIDRGKAYTKSAAALRIAGGLNGAWPLCRMFHLVPSGLRDGLYNYIASNRYKWFGQSEACMLPDPKVRERFLDY